MTTDTTDGAPAQAEQSAAQQRTELRLQLLANGYTPLANFDKACYLPGWPRLRVDEALVRDWRRQGRNIGTGLRVQDGLCVIDIDIDHGIIDDVIEVMLATLPDDCIADRLERSGRGHKLAWFVQTDDLFSRLHTRRWVAPGDTADDGTHSIEIFGGGSPRQFGAFGPHTQRDDGTVAVHYKWADESPVDVPLNALPILQKEQLFAMLDAAEAELRVQGFTPVERTARGEGAPGRVYDLTEDMEFQLDGAVEGSPGVSLSKLAELVKSGWTGRCSASWLEGPTAKNTKRCLISASQAGFVAIWESASGITHMPASIAPTDHRERVDRLAEQLRERKDARRARMSAEDDHETGAAKLMVSYAYVPTEKTPIVPLWAKDSDGGAMTVTAFRTLMQPYCGEVVGPRGGVKRVNPVDVWLSNPLRVTAAGLRMAPDKERPVYKEHGETWLNTYRPPNLGPVETGTPDGGISLIEQLVPDEREREWFWQWLAHKWQNPAIPGPGVILVSREYGTGRGTLTRLLSHMFGQRYVATVGFDIFTGQSYQSQYTEWGLGKLFAVVNESSATGDRAAHRVKRDVYEHLKEIVEPQPVHRLFVCKGDKSVEATAHYTTLMYTNNVDAVPLPKDDRRMAVLTGGQKRDPEFWEFINGWMGVRCNLAALGRYLDAVDLSSYDPYAAPLWTRAKEDMYELNRTDLDVLLDETLDTIEGMFVVEHVIRRMAQTLARTRRKLPDGWEGVVRRTVRRQAFPVRYPNGRKVAPTLNGVRYEALAMSDGVIVRPGAGTKDVREDLLENGNVFGGAGETASLGEKLKARKS